jgi:hypothetical protein
VQAIPRKSRACRNWLLAAGVAGCVAASAQGAVLFQRGPSVGTGWNESYWSGTCAMFTDCFTPVGAGDTQIRLDSISVDIRRTPYITGFNWEGYTIPVYVGLYVAEMTFDGTSYGRGETHFLGWQLLGAKLSASVFTESVSTNATGGMNGLTLNLQRSAMAGFGGWWVGVQFGGPNERSDYNRWRTVGAPVVGASINQAGVWYSNDQFSVGNLVDMNTGQPSSTNRLAATVQGTLVPAPGALALLGLAAVLGRRRV